MKDLARTVSEKNQKQMLRFLLRPKMRQITPLNATKLGDGGGSSTQTDIERQRDRDRQTDRQKEADRELL